MTVLIDESQDMQADALRGLDDNLADLRDLRADRGHTPAEPEEVEAFLESRRGVLRRLGLTGGGLATRGLVGGGIAAALVGALTKPVFADSSLDVMMLQTASSLEHLAVATYGAALGLPFISGGNAVIKTFAMTTMDQHNQHKMAFQAQTTALGGKAQDSDDPALAPMVATAKAKLMTPLDVVQLATLLEYTARDTYLADVSMFSDKKSQMIMSTVMGVETQHLATLLAVAALLPANDPTLIAIPVDASKLPAAAGSAGFPDAIPNTQHARPAQEGAVS
ncbi:MAG: ferritin-like domain-containing protein [Candidatus Dormibacteraeota bacterium]|uniref:Ferritin-like domain-containing protein n=1 Tax=Candidatus Aeolococcus gillhamiae TaxID=3127015 RepID=A0A934JZG0_9BACT|nr:ferritin-like domain-containing protein [Candidatus Dormibacteraeota bacterium]